jgi:hypothetical protein
MIIVDIRRSVSPRRRSAPRERPHLIASRFGATVRLQARATDGGNPMSPGIQRHCSAKRFAFAALLLGVAACSDADDELGAAAVLQSPCVADQLNLVRDLEDGQSCDNFGYSDCTGFASECVNYCAFEFCQREPCLDDTDCELEFGVNFECKDYVVSDTDYGRWCDESDCPRGTLGCPCLSDGTCGADPYGSGAMTCSASDTCESACPAACRVGGSVCCGGAFCSGDCIGTPCC